MGNVIANSGVMLRHLVSPGLWSSRAPFPLLPNYAIGVPHPQNFFEYDPLTVAPVDPVEWPSAESVGSYYIDNTHGSATDTANTYGYPDLPRLTIPDNVTVTAGDIVKVIGGGATYLNTGGDARLQIKYIGTQSNPCFFIGAGPSQPKFGNEIRFIGCSDLIVDGFASVLPNTVNFNVHGSEFWQRITLRNNTLVGDSSVDSGAVISAAGPAGNKASGLVLYNNEIRDFGENLTTSPENDMHGFKPTENCTDLWYIGNTSSNLGGDCVQVGDAATGFSELVERVYIAKNELFNCFENALDFKRCKDIIVSENEMYDFHQVNTVAPNNTGFPVIVHNNSEWVTFVANRIYASGGAIANTDGLNVHMIGNLAYDITPVGTYDPATAFGSGSCFVVRGASTGYIVNNTMYDYSKGIQIQSNIDYTVYNNIFANRNRTDGYEIMWANASDYTNNDNNYSNFYNPTYTTQFKRGGTVETLAQLQASTSREANATTGDPEFTSAPTDFSIGATSDALNNGTVAQIYADFAARYGHSIAIDISGVARPQGIAWDIGAYERIV